MSDVEVKAFAKAARWAGDSYRTIQNNIEQRFKTKHDLHTLWRWCNEDPDEVARFNRHRLAIIVDQDLEIATRTGELVRDRIEAEEDTFKLVGAWKTARDQVNTTVKIAQDSRHNSELLSALRAQLREQNVRLPELSYRTLPEDDPPLTIDAPSEAHHHARKPSLDLD